MQEPTGNIEMDEYRSDHPQDPVLSIREVHKSFGDAKVLKGVSMTVNRGDVVCIIGPSGSGKSTLLRCINGLVVPEYGSIRVLGQELLSEKTDLRALRRQIGMVFQQYNLFPHRTALDNTLMAPVHVLKQSRSVAREKGKALLQKVRLGGYESSFPGELSGGQQQRVAIARSLAMEPQLMLFDEVTAALDPETVKEVLVTIRQLVDEGMTCILVTHEMNFAREIADRIYFTDEGVFVEEGEPDTFFSGAVDPRTQRFLSHVL